MLNKIITYTFSAIFRFTSSKTAPNFDLSFDCCYRWLKFLWFSALKINIQKCCVCSMKSKHLSAQNSEHEWQCVTFTGAEGKICVVCARDLTGIVVLQRNNVCCIICWSKSKFQTICPILIGPMVGYTNNQRQSICIGVSSIVVASKANTNKNIW